MTTLKKSISLLCTAALLLSVSACGSTAITANDYSNTTLTGQVTAIEGAVVTLQLGELSEAEYTPPTAIIPRPCTPRRTSP